MNCFFYHHPNSSFVIDKRIPPKIREAFDEANSCHKMSLSIGSSASLRKVIFEILSHFEIPKTKEIEDGGKKVVKKIPYFERLDLLKDYILKKYPAVEGALINDVKSVYSLVSVPLHEQLPEETTFKEFTPAQFIFLMSVVESLLIEIFVETHERKERHKSIKTLEKEVIKKKSK